MISLFHDKYTHHLRNVDISFRAHDINFNLEQTLTHNQIYCLAFNEVAMYPGNDLKENFASEPCAS